MRLQGGIRRLTLLIERQYIIQLIHEAVQSGARTFETCKTAERSLRTYRQWLNNGTIIKDNRTTAIRPEPANKLIESEEQAIIDVCNQEEHAH
ncbi:hypothetical protein L0B53_03960 [Vibrio sp. SS-MA-C1-2]|uniref:hypothetical protein n=1 Tax=Vibrio sp. SS-MA-C1-2 TaxID=2908646 RepID=UPI001F191980|nr:hypothetical protein [Vibrio sp. SS-MA-C1-2]UJF17088.1 hypothetical protein L0B53_03960 [Vibrio sp. SS-MA-C1-2]